MKLKLLRYGHVLNHSSGSALSINGDFHCHTVEDEPREQKVYGETRIPAGTYQIKLRTVGGMHTRFTKKYPWHKGMLWLQDVPNFSWVYLHPGINEAQTDGCILVGYTAYSKGGFALARSLAAYKDLCFQVYDALLSGEEVTLEIVDGDL